MIVIPRATEKAYNEQTKRTYIFNVPTDASKQAVAAAVAKEYNVIVEDVRVLTRKGKKTRFSKGKHAYPGTTYRKDKKFAYVTLKEGDKIAIFEDPSGKKADKKAEEKKKNQKAKKEGDK